MTPEPAGAGPLLEIVAAEPIKFMSWRGYWGEAYGNDVLEHMIECWIPKEKMRGRGRPTMVSVVEEPCDYARNAMKLYPEKESNIKNKT